MKNEVQVEITNRKTPAMNLPEESFHSVMTISDELFDSEIWSEPLEKFSNAVGLTVSLYDQQLNRRCDVKNSGPIGRKLSEVKFWSENGVGTEIDRAAAQLCISKGTSIYSVQLEMFAHLAVPLIVDGKVLAVFVIGWIPEKFVDPVGCNSLAKLINVESMMLWQLMRMQQPISEEKLEIQGHLIETFSVPLIRQLMVKIEDRKRERRSKIVIATALAFAEASTEGEICDAAFGAIRNLLPTISITVEIIKSINDEVDIAKYSDTMAVKDLKSLLTSTMQKQLTIPISAVHGKPLGNIQIAIGDVKISEDALKDVQVIAGQFAIALQKVQLIHEIENERSALKGANLQLQHLHKMKDEFLATVSHELRTPLNAILGWAQILKQEGPTSRAFENAMDTIERNAKNQSHLIEDLLDVSRIISGKMAIARENVEVTSLLKQSIETVFPMTQARRQKIHVRIASSSLNLKGDATRITQIFWNLLSNASKFTPEGGDISVLLEDAGHYIRLEVSDSGKGISSEFLTHLFDRFSQADGSFTRRHGGLGLGLAIVRHLVELHGGTVSARSDGENQGSTFTVFLPQNTTHLELDSAQTLTKFISSDGSQAVQKLKGVKVLLVDDEPDALRLTRFVLEKYGASIEMADTALQGFQILQDWKPDILISDISMPGESGLELIRRIRFLDKEKGGHIPAIALTALAGQDQEKLVANAGFQKHISKPLDPNALYKAILDLLSKAH